MEAVAELGCDDGYHTLALFGLATPRNKCAFQKVGRPGAVYVSAKMAFVRFETMCRRASWGNQFTYRKVTLPTMLSPPGATPALRAFHASSRACTRRR